MTQDPHKIRVSDEDSIVIAMGREVRRLRNKLNMKVAEVAKRAGMSSGMLSKIENGLTSASLTTLASLARALNVPVTALFRQFEENRDASFVPAGQGIEIERRGTRAGHQYRLLGHMNGGDVAVEPYLITLTTESDTFRVFQHDGVEFLHILEGRVGYRHGDTVYNMGPGDSLFFDANALHGPEELIDLPIRFLSFIAYPRASNA